MRCGLCTKIDLLFCVKRCSRESHSFRDVRAKVKKKIVLSIFFGKSTEYDTNLGIQIELSIHIEPLRKIFRSFVTRELQFYLTITQYYQLLINKWWEHAINEENVSLSIPRNILFESFCEIEIYDIHDRLCKLHPTHDKISRK